jgi:hypothetical protein
MRNRIGGKKLRRLSDEFNKQFIYGLTRGNTNHRFDLWDYDGKEWCFYRNEKKLKRVNNTEYYQADIPQEKLEIWRREMLTFNNS